jgi:hypothetical protein
LRRRRNFSHVRAGAAETAVEPVRAVDARDLAEQKPGSVLVLEPETNLTRSESLEDFKTKTCEGW